MDTPPILNNYAFIILQMRYWWDFDWRDTMTNTKKKKSGFKNEKEAVKKPDVPSNWFYMSENEIGVVDIKTQLDKIELETEIWEEAGVLEIILGEAGSMDMEAIEDDFEDEYSRAFLEEHQVKSLFYVTIKQEVYDKAKEVMEAICGKLGGFFCGDTEDFTPIRK